ncbi:MAG TPA: type II toxin-antitoxin system HicA family toxin [Acidimicrobiales bacterium]|nr:type II toxin-antitoxin system HicA family toxin [Acidimicrobiales bacterium]
MANVARVGEWWIARTQWSDVTAQGASLEQAVDRLREAALLRQAPVPREQVVVAVEVVDRPFPTVGALRASGAEVQRVLERAGFVLQGRTHRHVLLYEERTGARVVVPLEVELAEPTLTDILRRAALRRDELRALL